jgi:hypothetical protein
MVGQGENARRVFFIAGNTPWHLWNDFGQRFDYQYWNDHFSVLNSIGVNATRVWIQCNGYGAVTLDSNGFTQTVPQQFWDDMDEFFKIAERHNIYIMATMTSFDHFNAGNRHNDRWLRMLERTATIDSFIEEYLLPFVERYKDNPYLFSIDLCNEPDWIHENNGVSWERIGEWMARSAVAVRENSDILFTVGHAMTKYTNERHGIDTLSDSFLQSRYNHPLAGIDFYSTHHYAWMTPYFGSPFKSNVSRWQGDNFKPVVVGEAPTISGEGHTLAQDFAAAFNNGIQGIFVWTTNGIDGNGGINELRRGLDELRRLEPRLFEMR